jgi:hypothetical protein
MAWLEDISAWVGVFVAFGLYVGKVKELRHVCGKQFHVALCESLSEADPSPAKEGYITVRVTGIAIWSPVKRMLWVPSVRQKLFWPLPLVSMFVQTYWSKDDTVILFEVVLSSFEVTQDKLR